MKKKSVHKKSSSKGVRTSSKNHACFFGMCICKHPSFILSLLALIAVTYGAIFLFAR